MLLAILKSMNDVVTRRVNRETDTRQGDRMSGREAVKQAQVRRECRNVAKSNKLKVTKTDVRKQGKDNGWQSVGHPKVNPCVFALEYLQHDKIKARARTVTPARAICHCLMQIWLWTRRPIWSGRWIPAAWLPSMSPLSLRLPWICRKVCLYMRSNIENIERKEAQLLTYFSKAFLY